MVARKNLSGKIRRVLARRMKAALGNGARVRVERHGYRDSLDVTVVSPRFGRTPWLKRCRLIWTWLDEDLTLSERIKIAGLIALTPAEARRMFRTGA